ncbi:MAG TPA: SoxR reducing system RseC family protein [Candidatus Cloacimonadota bacterium]|nr:SoxR reducing system RseC family protein [Candidatus Cloacimonadota bacterium]HPT71520.1 SoxR reducing system RseC family protein [Candidatus Cloacimonadota bacterium]
MTKEDVCTVVEVRERKITVEVCPSSGCANCSMSGVCGGGNKNKYFTLETDLPVKVGDQLILQIHGGSEVISSLILFLLPIIFMIIGFVVGRFILHLTEGTSVLISILGLGLSFFVVRLIDHFYGKKIYMSVIPQDQLRHEEREDENTPS